MTERSVPPLPPAVERLMRLRPRLCGCGLEELVCAILEAYPHLTDEEIEDISQTT